MSGPDVKLKQVCRWSDTDAAVFTPIADTTLTQFSGTDSYRTISMEEINQTLHEAGVNVAMINFTGATSCTITRSDAQADSQQTIQQWIDTQQPAAGTTTPVQTAGNRCQARPEFSLAARPAGHRFKPAAEHSRPKPCNLPSAR